MSQKFRPVKEIWNVHSGCFVEPEVLTTLLYDLAARVGSASDDRDCGDYTRVWFEDGQKVLNYIEGDSRFNGDSFTDSLQEQGVTVDKDELSALLGSMRTLVPQWRGSVGEHGELVFYVDLC
jgi:hypothetical protein